MIDQFIERIAKQDAKFLPSILNSRAQRSQLFDQVGNEILSLLLESSPSSTLEDLFSIYSEYTLEQNLLQARYEATGKYPFTHLAEANTQVYSNDVVMDDYMKALLMTQFLWPHHLEIIEFYINSFCRPLSSRTCSVLELAPGHGHFGRIFLRENSTSFLKGLDISRQAIEMCNQFARRENLQNRTHYEVQDILNPCCHEKERFDVIVAGELLEHVETPSLVLKAIHAQLKPNGLSFITAAITAANLDHVYEFKTEAEVLALLEENSLEISQRILCSSRKTINSTTPRVLAMIARKR